MRGRVLTAVALGLALSGCNEEKVDGGLADAIAAVDRVEVRSNSPDAVVKSWWEARDAGLALHREICKSTTHLVSSYQDKLSSLSTDEVWVPSGCGQALPVYEREITKVDIQSDTRAIVSAQIKNITPPEEGALFGAGDREAKEEGKPFQYLLERRDARSGWKISQVSHYPSYARSWTKVLEKPEPSTNRWVSEWHQ